MMRKALGFLPYFVFALVLSGQGHAQSNPEIFLFRPNSSPGSLDSDRYEVKSRTAGPVKEEVTDKRPEKKDQKKEEKKPVKAVEPVPLPIVASAPAQAVASAPVNAEAPAEPWTEVDPRFNYVEVTVAPGYSYLNSESASWFRDYYSAAPQVSVRASVWFNSSFGLSAGYMNSISGDITAEPDTNRKIEATQKEYDLEMLFRLYSGKSRKSTSMVAGFDYDEYQMLVSPNEQERIRLKTKGVGLVFGVRAPNGKKKAYTVMTTFRPELKVLEGGTDTSYRSGRLDSASSWALEFKSEHILNRKNIFFWSVGHLVERSVYKGTASEVDPITGTGLEGVSVTAGRTTLSIGVTWGD